MNKSKIFSIIFFCILFSGVNSVFAADVDIVDENFIFFDKLAKNPAYTGDSTSWNINAIGCGAGYYGGTCHFSVDKKFSQINSGLGVRFDMSNSDTRSGGLLYAYTFKKGEVNISVGSFIGISRYYYNHWIYTNSQRVFNKLRLSVGSSYNYKKHTFGISYDSEHFNESQNMPWQENVSILLCNYKTSINITNNLKINPELLAHVNFSGEINNNLYLSTEIKFKERIGLGLMTKSFKSTTYFASCRIKNRVNVGAFFQPYDRGVKSEVFLGLLINIKI